MGKFRNKSVVVAFQWTGKPWTEHDPAWLLEAVGRRDVVFGAPSDSPPATLAFGPFSGHGEPSHIAYPGDWIIRFQDGAIFPVKGDEFDQMWEPVEVEANGNLIAVAPDLLEACKEINAACDELHITIAREDRTVEMAGSPDLQVISDVVASIQKRAKLAIVKAEGKN